MFFTVIEFFEKPCELILVTFSGKQNFCIVNFKKSGATKHYTTEKSSNSASCRKRWIQESQSIAFNCDREMSKRCISNENSGTL